MSVNEAALTNAVVVAPPSSIRPFDITRPADWPRWVKLVEFNFTALQIREDSMKRAHFFTMCGEPLYNLTCNVLHPQEVDEVTYTDIVKKLTDHFRPQVNQVAAYYRFHHCNQKSGQSISEFVAELRKLASDCGFGAVLDNMIRNQLVCGIRDEGVRSRLLQREDLRLQDAIETASRAETALSHMQEMTTKLATIHLTPGSTKPDDKSKSIQVKHTECFRCAGDHLARSCPMDKESLYCASCEKFGHVARVCIATKNTAKRKTNCRTKWKPKEAHQTGTHRVAPPSGDSGNGAQRATAQGSQTGTSNTGVSQVAIPLDHQNLYCVSTPKNATNCAATDVDQAGTAVTVTPPMIVHLQINRKMVPMEVDSGAAVTVMHREAYERYWPSHSQLLQTNRLILGDYHGKNLKIVGQSNVEVRYRKYVAKLPLIVVEGCKDYSLLGRNWFPALGISVQGLHAMRASTSRPALQLPTFDHPALQVGETLGKYTGPAVSLDVDSQVKPIYLRSRSVPYAMEARVVDELQRLQEAGVIRPIRYSEWATPVVVVSKRDGSLRLCGDYKATLNKALRPDKYPLPSLDDTFVKLAGGRFFSKLDLDQAFNQLEMDAKSAQMLTINTIKGLFSVHRMPFGISAAPGIFQRLMEGLLAGQEGVAILMDDVFIAGNTKEEHDRRLFKVLDVLHEHGLKLKKNKCQLYVPSIEVLGFRVDADGIHPQEEKVEAIKGAPPPSNKTELQALLGIINFYDRFLGNRATAFEPLYRLLDKEAQWNWTVDHEEALRLVKDMLTSDRVLAHYTGTHQLVLACDASPYGISAVLSQIEGDGLERPIAYKSRTLTQTERNYAQIDKEALSFIFGASKFHKYIFGRPHVIFVTDHKPLLGIFKRDRQTPETLSPRMLRWSLFLNAYDYEFVHRPGKLHGNADALSRLPLHSTPQEEYPEPAGIHLLEVKGSPVNHLQIATATQAESGLKTIADYIRDGWPATPTPNVKPYWHCRAELSLQEGCILRGDRVLVPTNLRQRVLEAIHSSHHGIVRTKAAARGYVWWPGLTKDIESVVQGCQTCQEHRHNPPMAPPLPWPAASRSWERVHLDYLGPVDGQTFLIMVDAFSRFPVVKMVQSMSAAVLVQKTREVFADFGVPVLVVSDNGPQFTSQEFHSFLTHNGVKILHTPPFHPSSNGLVERAVGTFKDLLRKHTEGDWHTRVARVLFAMRAVICTATNCGAAERFYSKLRFRTPIDLLHPRSGAEVMPAAYTEGRRFELNDPVQFRDYRHSKPKWSQGTIESHKGRKVYGVRDDEGILHNRSIDQLIPRYPRIRRQDGPGRRTRYLDEHVEDLPPSSNQEGVETPREEEAEELLRQFLEQRGEDLKVSLTGQDRNFKVLVHKEVLTTYSPLLMKIFEQPHLGCMSINIIVPEASATALFNVMAALYLGCLPKSVMVGSDEEIEPVAKLLGISSLPQVQSIVTQGTPDSGIGDSASFGSSQSSGNELNSLENALKRLSVAETSVAAMCNKGTDIDEPMDNEGDKLDTAKNHVEEGDNFITSTPKKSEENLFATVTPADYSPIKINKSRAKRVVFGNTEISHKNPSTSATKGKVQRKLFSSSTSELFKTLEEDDDGDDDLDYIPESGTPSSVDELDEMNDDLDEERCRVMEFSMLSEVEKSIPSKRKRGSSNSDESTDDIGKRVLRSHSKPVKKQFVPDPSNSFTIFADTCRKECSNNYQHEQIKGLGKHLNNCEERGDEMNNQVTSHDDEEYQQSHPEYYCSENVLREEKACEHLYELRRRSK